MGPSLLRLGLLKLCCRRWELAKREVDKYESEEPGGRKDGAAMDDGIEGAVELVLPCRCFPGLVGYSLGPLGTRIVSRSALFLRVFRLGARSRFPRVADAGREGLRKVGSGSVVVRWNLRRIPLDSAGVYVSGMPAVWSLWVDAVAATYTRLQSPPAWLVPLHPDMTPSGLGWESDWPRPYFTPQTASLDALATVQESRQSATGRPLGVVAALPLVVKQSYWGFGSTQCRIPHTPLAVDRAGLMVRWGRGEGDAENVAELLARGKTRLLRVGS